MSVGDAVLHCRHRYSRRRRHHLSVAAAADPTRVLMLD